MSAKYPPRPSKPPTPRLARNNHVWRTPSAGVIAWTPSPGGGGFFQRRGASP